MKPDFEVIHYFLNRIGDRQRHTLATIDPYREGLHGATFELRQLAYMIEYIKTAQAVGKGVYYSLNEGVHVTKQRGYSGKLLANEIIKIHMLGFDIDFITGNVEDRIGYEQRALDLIRSHPLQPSIVVSTGGGLQVLFVLLVPLDVAMSNAKIPTEQEGRKDYVSMAIRDNVAQLYGDIVALLSNVLRPLLDENIIKIDKLSNIDRVFRLPGTINFPTEAKIAKGATTRLAKIIYDTDKYFDFFDLREAVPNVTPAVDRKPKTEFVERYHKNWNAYKKAYFLCEYIKDHKLIDDNQNYTHDLMFPLFGMINRNEITAAEGRELWLMATSTGRETAYGNYEKKWDSRKIANYTNRDLGSLIHFCRSHDCLIPWSSKDEEKKLELEARDITLACERRPVYAEDDLLADIK